MILKLHGEFVTLGTPVCYQPGNYVMHDGPVIFIGECGHPRVGGKGLIDVMGVPEGEIEHKAAESWKVCHHFDTPGLSGSGFYDASVFGSVDKTYIEKVADWRSAIVFEEIE